VSTPPRASKAPRASKRPSVAAPPEPFVDPAPVSERSLRRIYEAAQQIEAQRHVDMFLRAADEALAAGDAIAAANHYRLALQNREDPYIRAKLDDVDALARTKRHEINLSRAKDAERRERWADAAAFYARAHDAKPSAHLAERAANMMRLSAGDLERATELAEWATRADENNAAGFVTLAELYDAQGESERAASAARRAIDLAPNDARAKALAKRLKGSRGGR
jgi:tetratricopeptide (TPR) repeat protein